MLCLIVELPISEQDADAGLRFAQTGAVVPRLGAPAPEDAASSLAGVHGRTPLALLPRSDEVVAVVPASRLSWHKVVLPRVARTRWRAALDSLLEERVLGESTALLHVALQPGAQAGTPVWVAVCDKVWLKTQLDTLAAAGRQISRVVPAFEPLGDGLAPQWFVQGNEAEPWLVRCADDGVQCLPLSPAALQGLGLTNPDGHDLGTVRSEPSVAAMTERLMSTPVAVRHEGASLLAAAGSPWNLAQFDLASTAGLRLFQRISQTLAQLRTSPDLRPVRWGVAVLLVVQVTGLQLWAWKESAALKARQAQVRQLLTQTFPKVAVVIDPPLQMAREVAALRSSLGAAGAADLEPMLGALAAQANQTHAAPGLSGGPTRIDFETGELRLTGLTLPAAQAAQTQDALRKAGYSLRQEASVLRLTPLGSEGGAGSEAATPGAGAKP